MRKFFLYFIIVVVSSLHAAGQLQVIQVRGHVTLNGNDVQPGERIPQSPGFKYRSKNDQVIAIDTNGESKRFFLKYTKKKKSAYFSAVLPSDSSEHFSVTPLPEIFASPAFIQEDINSTHMIIVQETNRYLFDKRIFPQSTGKFLLKASIGNLTLRTHNDTLYIDRDDFLELTQEHQTFSLIYQSNNGVIKTIAAHINPYFDNAGEMPTMINSIVGGYRHKNIPQQLLFLICLAQVYHNIGKPAWLNFKLEFQSAIAALHDTISHPVRLYGTGALIRYDRTKLKELPRGNHFLRVQTLPAYLLTPFAPYPGFQGTTGTCTGYACAYSAGSLVYKKLTGHTDRLSPEFIYKQVQPDPALCESQNGGIAIPDALKRLTDTGDIFTTDTAFHCQDGIQPGSYSNAAQYRLFNYDPVFLYSNHPDGLDDDDIDLLKEKISQSNEPIVISFFIPKTPVNSITNIKGATSFDSLSVRAKALTGIWFPSNADYIELQDRVLANHPAHTVCIIGYDNSVRSGAFLVLNSWSTAWGSKGLFWLRYDDLKKFGIDGYAVRVSTPALALAHFNFQRNRAFAKKIALIRSKSKIQGR